MLDQRIEVYLGNSEIGLDLVKVNENNLQRWV